MDEIEFNEMLIEYIRQGHAIALLEQGEIKIYHIEYTDDEMLKNALPLADIERLLASGEAE